MTPFRAYSEGSACNRQTLSPFSRGGFVMDMGPRDLIAVLQAMDEAGALHGALVMQ
jgi:flagellar basal body P-ring protein FlgI